MKKLGILFLLVFPILAFKSLEKRSEFVNDETPVMKILHDLGEDYPDHYIMEPSEEDIRMGKDLIEKGWTVRNGKKTKMISKHFKCISCHNTVQEEPQLNIADPEARLTYSMENNIPFLQGTTFYGMVNRKSWYNGDYEKKYGEWIASARDSLQGAIQLCAKVCSSGRYLDEWEMKAILSYLRTLEYKLGDLDLTDDDYNELDATLYKAGADPFARTVWLAKISSSFLEGYPATFGNEPADKKTGFDYKGDPIKGEYLFNNSCGHCHRPYGESMVLLDDSKMTKQFLKYMIPSNTDFSLYHIIRHGTHAQFGSMAYMPQYTMEKMSDKQIEDLRAYIEGAAE